MIILMILLYRADLCSKQMILLYRADLCSKHCNIFLRMPWERYTYKHINKQARKRLIKKICQMSILVWVKNKKVIFF